MAGGVPKARRPFSIFLAHDRLKNETIYGNGNLFKIGAQRWSDLSSEQKDHYCELSKKEHSAKHAAQQFYGLRRGSRGKERSHGTKGAEEGPAAADGQASVDHSDAWKIVKEGVTMKVCDWGWKTGAATLLGHGSYGAVFRATHAATGRLAAVKVYAFQSELDYEERILRVLPPFLFPTVLAVSSGPGPSALIMQLYEKDLKKVIRAGECTETVMSCVVRQILAALSWLHSQNLVHNDVKPANILWTGLHSHAILADFSMTSKAGAEILANCQGTVNYRPPELLRQRGLYPAAPATDVWSFGCTIWEAAGHEKEPLFTGLSEPTVLAQVLDFQRTLLATESGRLPGSSTVRVARAGAYRAHVLAFCRLDPKQRNSTGLGHPLRRAPAPATSEVQTPAFPN